MSINAKLTNPKRRATLLLIFIGGAVLCRFCKGTLVALNKEIGRRMTVSFAVQSYTEHIKRLFVVLFSVSDNAFCFRHAIHYFDGG